MPRTRSPKSAPYSVILHFDAELRATIRGATRLKGVRQQLAGGQFCISPSIESSGSSFMIGDLYPDMMPKGVFRAALKGNVLAVRLRGEHILDASDFAADRVFCSAADAGAALLVSLSDAELEPLAVDGKGTCPQIVGTLRSVSSAPVKNSSKTAKSRASKDPLTQALALALAPADEVPASAKRLAKRGEVLDYTLERQLERLGEALRTDLASVATALASLGADLDALGESLRATFLEGGIDSCGCELKVRAAEALGAWSIATAEPKRTIVKRLSSTRFEHRMWAAQAVRASGWKDAAALLKPLARDRFCDSDGYFLVREAAGFGSDR